MIRPFTIGTFFATRKEAPGCLLKTKAVIVDAATFGL